MSLHVKICSFVEAELKHSIISVSAFIVHELFPQTLFSPKVAAILNFRIGGKVEKDITSVI